MKKIITAVILATSGLLITNSVFAAELPAKTSDAQFKVKIEIIPACKIFAGDIDFGQVASNVNPDEKNGSIQVTCTKETTYDVSFSSDRLMKHSTDKSSTIAYELLEKESVPYSDSHKFVGTGNGLEQNIPLIAKIANGATNVRAGDYSSAVTATVTY